MKSLRMDTLPDGLSYGRGAVNCYALKKFK